MKRGPLLIAICSSIVVAAIAAWPVIRIAQALEDGRAEARASFSELRLAALNTVATPDDAAGDAWREKAAAAWRKQDRLLAIIVKDTAGEVLYAKPGSSPYYARTDEGLSFERPEGTTTRMSGLLSSGIAIEALYVTLSQEAVFYPVRDAAVVFAALLAILVAWLLVVSSVRTDDATAVEEPARAGDDPAAPFAAVAEVHDDWIPTIPDLLPEESSLYSENPFAEDEPLAVPLAAPALEEPLKPADRSEPPATAEAPVAEASAEEAPAAAFIRPADLPEGVLDGPRGLFDAETGLGWEAYLRERLSAELRRSASFEQDLSLVITSFDGSKRGDEEFNLFASTVRDFFSFKDMAFLFGTGGAALILPNMDVDHALRMSEELHKKLSRLFRSQNDHGTSRIHIGLSSRAGRLVDADRIIGEAMAAVSKATDGSGASIMAFRPDPEKFRAYLAGQ